MACDLSVIVKKRVLKVTFTFKGVVSKNGAR